MNAFSPEHIRQKLAAAYSPNFGADGYAEIADHPNVTLRCAAVLIPLFMVRGEWHVLFTRRTDRVESHKGQVSFPGGACDEGETTPEQTALREAHEEVGIHPKDVDVLGCLTPMVTISFFRVTPVVGVIPFPYAFMTSGAEVARVFSIPLLWLAEKDHHWQFSRGEKQALIAYHPYDGELVWGATGRMTYNFLNVIGAVNVDT